ncbi:MAG: ferredoxin family protein [Planctomycetes bacterium]|nr:ferredoxin family protein [Planctomycetota bacterium]
MTYVVGEPCVGCKYGDCVTDCPVDCFYQAPESLYINPDECIDCGQCLPLCPVDAIFVDDDGPANPDAYVKHPWQDYIALNANFDFSEDKRVTSKDAVEHGPDWDESKA